MTVTLRHDAGFYSDRDDFARQYTPFLLDGLEASEAVIVVTTEANLDALRHSLGPRAADVDLIDAATWFDRPELTIRAYHHRFSASLRRGHSAIRVLGEVQFGSTEREQARWIEYESLLNYAFADAPAWIVCPYHTEGWPQSVSCSAEQTHDHVYGAEGRSPSSDYVEPHRILTPLVTLPDSPATVEVELPQSLARVRRTVRQAAISARRPQAATDDLVVVCSELVSNVARHAGDAGRLRIWMQPDGPVFGAIDDEGPGFGTLTGYRPPADVERTSRGLWLVRQLCQEVDIRPRHPVGARVTFRI